MATAAPRPDYGIDAPTRVFTFVALTFVLAFAGIFFGSGTGSAVNGLPFWIAGVGTLVVVVLLVVSSRWGKRSCWTRLLDELALRGDEDALDLGCGRGLVLVETAVRLPDGHATGVDCWRTRDLSGNQPRATELNVGMVGVADRVTVRTADLGDLPFPDDAFDLVTASLALRHVAAGPARATAVDEALRVVRPGGRLVVLDTAGVDEVRGAAAAAGWEVSTRRAGAGVFPPATVLVARRPG